MNVKINKTIRLVYGCVFGAVTAVVAALLIWQVLDIYISWHAAGNAGAGGFTRLDVIARLRRISPSFWVWIVTAVAGFVLYEVFPVKQTPYIKQDVRYTLYRMKKKMPRSMEGEYVNSLQLITREEKILKILWICFAAFCAVGIVYGIVYLSIPSHFPNEEVTDEVLKLVLNIMPFVAAAMLIACAITVYEGISAKKQIPEVKKLISLKLPAEEKKRSAFTRKLLKITGSKKFLLGLRIAVGCLGVAFVIAGICNGNMAKILEKAINICMECIGLG